MVRQQSIPREEFAEQARRLGVNERQTERWREANLIPRPTRVSLGRGKGMRSEYPTSAVRNLRAVVRMMAPNDPLWLVGWKLWWRGYDIPDTAALEAVRQSVEEVRAKALTKVKPFLPGGDEGEDEAEFDQSATDKALRQLRRNPFYRRLYRALGADDFASCVQTLAAIGVNDPECQMPEHYWPEDHSVLQDCGEVPLTQILSRLVKQLFSPEALAVANKLHGEDWLNSKDAAETVAELSRVRLLEVALTVSAGELQTLRQHLQTFRMVLFLLGGQPALSWLDTLLDSRLSPLFVAGGFGQLARTHWGAEGIAGLGQAIQSLGQ